MKLFRRLFNQRTILLLFIITGIVHSQSVSFKKEKIEITIENGYGCLKGDYYFENRGFNRSETDIFYPFPVGDLLPYPDSISVFNTGTSQNIPFKRLRTGIAFNLSAEPHSLNKIEIFYRQKLISNYFEYILTTTADWKAPLEISEFIINVPRLFMNVQMSYNEDSVISGDSFVKYFITRREFMPEKNLIIKWSEN